MVFEPDDSYIELMKRNNKTLACLLAGVTAAVQTVSAITADNPYTSAITNRNLFSLKAPVDPATLVTPLPPPNVPKVMLTGITTLMGGKRCILRVPVPARGQTPAKEVSLFKAEQDSMEEGIQVLEIDIATSRVKINNNGTEQTLDIIKDSPKSPAPPAAVPGLALPKPVAVVGAIPQPPPTTLIQRTPRLGAGPAYADPASNPANNAGGGAANAGNPAQQGLSLEQQTILIEMNRIATQKQVDAGELPPLPPTDAQEIMDADAAAQPQRSGPGAFPR